MPVMTDTDEEVLPAFNDLDYRYAYREFTYDYPTYSSVGALRRGFIRQLARKTSEPEKLSNLGWCGRCTYPDVRSSMMQIGGGQSVCSTCARHYVLCPCCTTMVRTGYLHNTMDFEEPVCQSCFSRYHRYCNTCEDYYHRTNFRDHRHGYGGDSCCESRVTNFRVQNNGDGLLKNDKKVKITLAAGEISTEGLEVIRKAVLRQRRIVDTDDEYNKWGALSDDLSGLGNQWQTKEGNYSKRLSRFAYKRGGLKVPPELMTQVGNAARDHSIAVDFTIAVTRKLNLSARDFAHPESCWWTSYSTGRCMLKTNGGFGIRTFNGRDVSGRAWVFPLKKRDNGELTPTYETATPDAFVVFNGYGDLTGYAPARIMAHMNGMTYRKVEFNSEPMYVNSGSGYLIGPEELVAPYTDGRLSISMQKHSSLFELEQRQKELVNA